MKWIEKVASLAEQADASHIQSPAYGSQPEDAESPHRKRW